MTMFDFMANAFYMLCGVLCVGASMLVVFGIVNGIIKAIGGNRQNGRNKDRR